jgi:hypothetical protein
MFAEFGHEVEAEVCTDAGRHVVEQQWERGFVGEATEPVGESGGWNFEVERGGGHDCDGTGTVSMVGKQERFSITGVGDTAEHRDTAVNNFADTIDDFVSVSIAERRTFPGCSQSEDPGDSTFEDMFYDLCHGGCVEKAVGSEWRDDRGMTPEKCGMRGVRGRGDLEAISAARLCAMGTTNPAFSGQELALVKNCEILGNAMRTEIPVRLVPTGFQRQLKSGKISNLDKSHRNTPGTFQDLAASR